MIRYLLLLFCLVPALTSAQTARIFPLGFKAENVHHTGDI
jgi:hypothetical protein